MAKIETAETEQSEIKNPITVDFEQLLRSFSHQMHTLRKAYHLTLGGLITDLEKAPRDLRVMVELPENRSCMLGDGMSYRGYYEDLAFEPIGGQGKTVADFLKQCEELLGTTQEGYKGGGFMMEEDTPVWVSPYGMCSNIAMMWTRIEEGHFVIVTKRIER